ncbi:MAG: ABC transporter permease [Cyanobacteria bacterium J055]|nr:MAG: ABC transporter permease [Cyanobacteria bacterium J055]
MIIDRIGNWNPQLFRELKGRLTGRNLAIATTLSLLGQLIFGWVFYSRLPLPPDIEKLGEIPNNDYCTGSLHGGAFDCVPDGLGYWQINWSFFWWHVAAWSGVAIIVMLVVGGVYLLVGDLAKEQQRGTLNFIRLSPQSSESILIGKILGVPILVYLAAALVLPLHFGSAIAAGVSIDTILRFYGLTLAGCAFLYNVALLLGFLGGSAWLACLVVGLCQFPSIGLFRLMFPTDLRGLPAYPSLPELQWFYLPLGEQIELLHVFAFCSFAIGTFWLWQAVNRRFRDPNATISSKRQSYLAMACVQVFFVGFILVKGNIDEFSVLSGFSVFNLLVFLIGIAALTPQRAAVQEWARYRHLHPQGRSELREWILGEKSPALVAIAINLAITAIVWMPAILMLPAKSLAIAIVGLLAAAILIWIYAAIVQVLLLLKTKKRAFIAVGAVLGAIVLPPICAFVFAIRFSELAIGSHELWSFVIFGVGLAQAESLAMSTILLGFLGQVCAMGTLSWQLRRITRKLGASDTQVLLQERRVGVQ